MTPQRLSIFNTRFFEVLISALTLTFTFILNIDSIRPALNQLMDFGSFIATGQAARQGTNPYGIDSPLVYTLQSKSTGENLPSPNLNPPISILLFMPLSQVDPQLAVTGWRIATILLFVTAVLIHVYADPESINGLRIFWAISLAGLWHTLSLGQIYAPLLLLTTGAILLLTRKSYILAGILLGFLSAIKPNFAVWAALLFIAGYTSTAISAGVTTFGLSIIPLFVFGPEVYWQWVSAVENYPPIGLLIAGNSSIVSLGARLGWTDLGTVGSVVLVAAAAYFVYRHRPGTRHINTLGIAGAILISPFSWPGYTILTLPIFLGTTSWSWQLKLAAVCLIVPYPLILLLYQRSLLYSVLFGWIYGWGMLLILADLLQSTMRATEPPNTEQR